MNKNEKVFICYATSGMVYNGFMQTIVNIVGKRPEKVGGMFSVSGPYLTTNRNNIVREFLDSPYDWLFSFDTDIETSLEDFDKIIDAADAKDRPIVAGKYFIFIEDGVKICAKKINDNLDMEDGGDWLEEYPDDEVIPIWATGMGFVLIHRSVFEKIAKNNLDKKFPWFYDGYLDKRGNEIGEDIFFYEQARKVGIPVHLHTGASAAHLGKIAITEKTFIESNDMVWK
jgi:GT2 family glycosyltransferase